MDGIRYYMPVKPWYFQPSKQAVYNKKRRAAKNKRIKDEKYKKYELKKIKLMLRNKNILKEYRETDATLQKLADKYKLSRERIRSICENVRRIENYSLIRALHSLQQVCNVIKSINVEEL